MVGLKLAISFCFSVTVVLCNLSSFYQSLADDVQRAASENKTKLLQFTGYFMNIGAYWQTPVFFTTFRVYTKVSFLK